MNRKYMFAAAFAAMAFRQQEPGTDGAGAAAIADAAAKVNQPDAAAVAPPAPTAYVQMVPVKFHFKKEKIRDEAGKEIGEGKKLPSASLFLPIPKTDYLVEVLSDTTDKYAKEKALLMDAVSDIVYSVARMQINAFRETNKETPITMSVLNLEALDWNKIANMPKGERGTTVPSDEDIKAFLDSYLEVMPAATNKSKEKIENHVALFTAKFKKQRAQKDLLEVFQQALGIYTGAVSEEVLEDNLAVVEYYDNMLSRMLKSEEKITMDDI